MAQAAVDLRSTRQLAIKLYGENRRLKKEIKRLQLRAARVHLLEDDDVLEIDVNQDERKEVEAEKSLWSLSQVPPRKTKKVCFSDKIEVRVIPSRPLWCENCREKGDHTCKDCALPSLYCKLRRHYGHRPKHCRSNMKRP